MLRVFLLEDEFPPKSQAFYSPILFTNDVRRLVQVDFFVGESGLKGQNTNPYK